MKIAPLIKAINCKEKWFRRRADLFCWNTMIDTLLQQQPFFRKPPFWDELKLSEQNYIVMTLHRPANVDEENKLGALLETIIQHSRDLPLIFPVHPRTKKMLEKVALNAPNLFMTEPLGYQEFNYLVERAKAVITDSGGITEETTVMGVPCMTLRNSTERPETVSEGTNELLGTDPSFIGPAFQKLFGGQWKRGSVPMLWDGKSAERIVEKLLSLFL